MDWMDEHADAPPERRTTRRPMLLVALAVVPWLVVAALLLAPGRTVTEEPAATPPADTGHGRANAAPSEATPAEGAPADTTGPPATGESAGVPPRDGGQPDPGAVADPSGAGLELLEIRGQWRAQAGAEEAASVAVAVARAWLTGLEPRLHVDGVEPVDDRAYVEHLVVEAVEQPAAGASVVTLVAVVLDGEELLPRVRRLAVPVSWGSSGPQPAGTPWWLPAPSLRTRPLERAAVEDDAEELAVLEALAAAGFEVDGIDGLWRTGSWPMVAEVRARTPAGDRLDGPVWLRPHQGGYVVGGTTVTAAGEPTSWDEEEQR